MFSQFYWLRFFRPINLFIIGLTQSLVFVYMNDLSEANKGISLLLASTLILSTMLAAAAGYIINDIYDAEIDSINKSNKRLINNVLGNKSIVLYYTLLVLSFLTAFYFDYQIRAIWFSVYQIVIAFFLWLYAKYLKKIALVGNLLVSILCAMVIMVVVFSYAVVLPQSVDNQFIWVYVLFAFFSNLYREIIKDIEDIEGDKAGNCKTLPIIAGLNSAKWLAIFVMLLLSSVVFLTMALAQYQFFSSLIIIICFALIFQTYKAQYKAQFSRISQITKLLMFLGLLYLVL